MKNILGHIHKYFNVFTITCGTGGIFITNLLGGVDVLLQTVLLLIVLDYFTGILKAVYTNSISSEVGWKGIIKKIFIVVLISVANLVEVSTDFTGVRGMVIFFFIANEGLSILENAAICGLPIPPKLRITLIQVREWGKITEEEAEQLKDFEEVEEQEEQEGGENNGGL